jgi:deoxyribonuclease-4
VSTFLGAHMSIQGGLYRALERGKSVGCNTVQMFTHNSTQWAVKDLLEEDVALFKKEVIASGMGPVFAHGSYLMNLAGPGPFYEKSIQALTTEIRRDDRLGLQFVVLHPGAHMGSGEEASLSRIVDAVDRVVEATPNAKCKIVIENTAGQGSCLGCSFTHLEYIWKRVRIKNRIGFCIDTCHLFASGYDIRTQQAYGETFDRLGQHIPLKSIAAFHLNDSKKPLGSRVDRHEHIGKGFIGLQGFRFLMNDPRFQNVPKVLETPKGPDLKEDKRNLRVLRRLIEK